MGRRIDMNDLARERVAGRRFLHGGNRRRCGCLVGVGQSRRLAREREQTYFRHDEDRDQACGVHRFTSAVNLPSIVSRIKWTGTECMTTRYCDGSRPVSNASRWSPSGRCWQRPALLSNHQATNAQGWERMFLVSWCLGSRKKLVTELQHDGDKLRTAAETAIDGNAWSPSFSTTVGERIMAKASWSAIMTRSR